MTPGGALDLSNVLFRNRIIFIGQPVNAMVAQRVISQLVTLASIDEDADILVSNYSLNLLLFLQSIQCWVFKSRILKQILHSLCLTLACLGVPQLPWWKHLLGIGNL